MNTTAAATKHPAAVIVHDLDQANRVLAAAERTGRPVRLCSPPAAAPYLGPAVFKSMIDQARADNPKARATACLDCGDEAGTALAALRHGIDAISLTAAPDVLEKIADMARQSGAEIMPPPSHALDMAATRADDDLADWLLEGTCDG